MPDNKDPKLKVHSFFIEEPETKEQKISLHEFFEFEGDASDIPVGSGCLPIYEGTCTGCEIGTECEICETVACQNCEGATCQTCQNCEGNCLTTCEVNCQDCEGNCLTGCQVNCQCGGQQNQNSPPSAPNIVSPVSGAGYTLNRRPVIRLSVSDPNGNSLKQINLQFDSAITFSSPISMTASINVPSGTIMQFTPTSDAPLGLVYCRARVHDGSVWGSYSSTITFTVNTEAQVWTIPSEQIADNSKGIPLSVISELRVAVENARAFRALTAPIWTDSNLQGPPIIKVRGIHLEEIRTRLQEVLAVVGITATWTDPVISSLPALTSAQILADPTVITGKTTKKGKHWTEMREALKSI